MEEKLLVNVHVLFLFQMSKKFDVNKRKLEIVNNCVRQYEDAIAEIGDNKLIL